MADERDLELLDDYLSNRMSEEDRLTFEKRLQADPDLKNEYVLQKRLIQAIKDTRAAELKAMLRQVPVPAHGTGNALATKIILGTLASLMIVAAAYWYTNRPDAEQPQEPIKEEKTFVPEVQPQPLAEPAPNERREAAPEDQRQQPQVEQDKNQTSAGTEHSRPSLAKKPDPVQVPAPKERGPSAGDRDVPSTDIVTIASNESYQFHYAFSDGKLVLYGPFEEGSFEVVNLERDGERSMFLAYRDNFYRIDPAGAGIRPLETVKDQALLQQLKQQRPQ